MTNVLVVNLQDCVDLVQCSNSEAVSLKLQRPKAVIVEFTLIYGYGSK